ncbi:hypothetical protein [Streptomyces sp. NRRL F-5727]|uniref:hypothetical protein n=1 Tax=Streptomyces sp. NRRL F-5727 TaxID=1463871 RepID=UPI000AE0D7D6|nr:hypothetical protein [Streptomyces sp. NRRL F-5727]
MAVPTTAYSMAVPTTAVTPSRPGPVSAGTGTCRPPFLLMAPAPRTRRTTHPVH